MRVHIVQQGSHSEVEVPEGATIRDALDKAHIDSLPEGTLLTRNGFEASEETVLEDGDIVVIQRPYGLG